jgi:hypothetical protein
MGIDTFIPWVCCQLVKMTITSTDLLQMDNELYEAAETLASGFESEIRSITPPLDDSSDEEARVRPSTPDDEQLPPELTRIFTHYRNVAEQRRRRTMVRGRMVAGRRRNIFISSRRMFEEEEDERRSVIEERMLEADTAIAIRISMATYKPHTTTVEAADVRRRLPPIAARHQKDKCPICLEHVKRGESIRILPCGHYQHATCTMEWFTRGNSFCPICRDKTFERKPTIKKRRRANI